MSLESDFLKKIDEARARAHEIEKALESPEVARDARRLASLAKEHKTLQPILKVADEFATLRRQMSETQDLLHSTSDPELKVLAREELERLEARYAEVEQTLKRLLIPKDPQDAKNAIVEIRAGTGGQEAALFAGDLYRMYSRFVDRRGWSQEVLGSSPSELGGFKEIVFAVNGPDAYGILKFESGVHRVQRVPVTETSGRIHTSAASVVVLPEAEEIDVEIDPKDLRIDVYRSSGPGGQSVNTTDSAVRITHLPTGLVVTCQDEKSQHKNKAKALKVLRARLYDLKRREEMAKVVASRRLIIGSGDRSAKIRTYNFPQNRVTDHRIDLTLYRLQEILDGEIDELIERLQIAEQDERIKET